MKAMKWLLCCLFALTVVLLPAAASAGEIARVHVGGSQVNWEPLVEHDSLVLTVSRPDESTARQELAAGQSPVFVLAAGDPDGVYTWELRANPRLSAEVQKELQAARKSGDPSALWRLRKEGKLPGDQVQSGSFTVERGAIVPPDQGEEKSPAANKPAKKAQVRQNDDLGVIFEADQVIPDDLIVQGSGCFGFDCVNNESFGFDTIRLKENNLRIKFEDTSVGTFPTNDWQLTANDSASGGSSKFSIEDITGAKVPFTVTAGASTNSIFVDSTGRVGFRTSTPVLDLHVATSNTPAIRLEQNNSGGFTAQTWDIAGNEANFFVRDVTGGSRLPFRIRPGAPTSSIDISADGDVGIGTASPDARLDVVNNAAVAAVARFTNTSGTGFSGFEFFDSDGTTQGLFMGTDNQNNNNRINSTSSYPLLIMTNTTERIRFPAPGTDFIQATNGAELTAGGVWQDNSSRASKRDIVELSETAALEAFQKLNPVTFRYKAEPDEEYVGFIAEDLPDLVATNDRQHMNSTDVVAVLTKIVQQQQKTIEDLSTRLADLEKEKQ